MATNPDGREIDPDFDGRAEHPFDAMTPAQKLDYIWERAVDLHWAQSVREANAGPAAEGQAQNQG